MPLWSGLEEAPLRGQLPAAWTAAEIIPTFRFAQGILLFSFLFFTHPCSNVFSFFLYLSASLLIFPFSCNMQKVTWVQESLSSLSVCGAAEQHMNQRPFVSKPLLTAECSACYSAKFQMQKFTLFGEIQKEKVLFILRWSIRLSRPQLADQFNVHTTLKQQNC